MPAGRIGPGPLADRQAVVNVAPMLGRSFGRIDAERLDDIDRLRTFSTFGQPARRSKLSPPGRTKGTVE